MEWEAFVHSHNCGGGGGRSVLDWDLPLLYSRLSIVNEYSTYIYMARLLGGGGGGGGQGGTGWPCKAEHPDLCTITFQ